MDSVCKMEIVQRTNKKQITTGQQKQPEEQRQQQQHLHIIEIENGQCG